MSNAESPKKEDKFWIIQEESERKRFQEEVENLTPLMAITFFTSVDEVFAYAKQNPNDIPDGILVTTDRPPTQRGQELKDWADDNLVRVIKHYHGGEDIVSPFGIDSDISLQATIELLRIRTLL